MSAKIKSFLLTYKWLLVPLIPLLFFISLLFLLPSLTTPSSSHITPSTTPSNLQNVGVSQIPQQTSPTPEQGFSNSLAGQVSDIASGNLTFPAASESSSPIEDFIDEPSLSQQTLPDGSIKYEYQSNDPNRPHIQIVENNVVIFRRIIVSDVGITISDYSEYLTNPPYISKGSAYYGPNAVILANPGLGIAVVYNPQSDQVYEQYIFQATSIADFVKKYGKDITSFNPAP